MFFKLIKIGSLTVAGGVVAGALFFGGEAASYLRSSARSVRASVRENIPVDFELRRARDLLDEMLPEMQANVRLIAGQEVDIDAANADIGASEKSLAEESARIQKLREALSGSQSNYTFAERTFTREQLKQDLARRFDLYREAEATLAAKRKLLGERQRSLAAAETQLEHMRDRKGALEAQVEALAGQYRLVQMASSSAVGQPPSIDAGKLAQAEKLVAEIRKQLNVAEHVLAREATFTQPIPVDIVDEQDLLSRVDQHFSGGKASTPSASAAR